MVTNTLLYIVSVAEPAPGTHVKVTFCVVFVPPTIVKVITDVAVILVLVHVMAYEPEAAVVNDDVVIESGS